jgi:hypothetical protein
MNGMDPLAALRPLHAPPPVSWWPPAPGWWLLLVILALVILLLIRRWRHNAPRRAALRELKALAQSQPDALQQVAMVNRLLKRYALICWPRIETAALTGESWLRFLDAHGGKGAFSGGSGRVLASQPYASPESHDASILTQSESLFRLARRWIKRNRPKVSK